MDYRALITTSGVDEEKVRSGVLKTWSVMFDGLQRTARPSG
jgi:hypothetical protein